MNRWTVGIGMIFVAFFVANGVMLWYALHNQPALVESYQTEPR